MNLRRERKKEKITGLLEEENCRNFFYQEDGRSIRIWLLNIRALTKFKMVNLNIAVSGEVGNIIYLTETHEKFKTVDISKGFHNEKGKTR